MQKRNFRTSREKVKNHFNESCTVDSRPKRSEKANYWDNAMDELDSLHIHLQEIRYKMSPTKEGVEEYSLLKKNYREASNVIDDLKYEKEMLFDALNVTSIQSAIDHVRQINSENQMLKSELSNSQCERERLSTQIKKRDTESNEKIDNLREKLEGLEEEYQKQGRALLEANSENAKLRKARTKAKLLLKKAETSCADLNERLSLKTSEFEELRNRESKLTESVAQLKQVIAQQRSESEKAELAASDQVSKTKKQTVLLMQKLADTEAERDKLKIETNTLSSAVQSKNDTIAALKAENNELETAMVYLRQKESECEKHCANIRSLNSAIESKDDKIVALTRTVSELKSELQILQAKDDECTRLSTRITSLRNDIRSKTDQIEDLVLENGKMKSLSASLQKVEKERNELTEFIESLRSTLELKNQEIENLSEQLKILPDVQEECENLKGQIQSLTIVIRGKDDTIDHLTASNNELSDTIKRLESVNLSLSNKLDVAAFEMESLRRPQTPQIIRNSDTDPDLLRRKIASLKAHGDSLANQIVSLQEENRILKDANKQFLAKLSEQNMGALEEQYRIERERRKGLAKLLANIVRMWDEKIGTLLAEMNDRIDAANMNLDEMTSAVSSINVSTNSTFLIQQCQILVDAIWKSFGKGDTPVLARFTRFPSEFQKLIGSVSTLLQVGVARNTV